MANTAIHDDKLFYFILSYMSLFEILLSNIDEKNIIYLINTHSSVLNSYYVYLSNSVCTNKCIKNNLTNERA